MLAEIERLRAAVGQQAGELARLRAFWKRVQQHLFSDICSNDAREWAVKVGLLMQVPYDPTVHGEVDGAEAGDPIYVDAPEQEKT